MEKTSAIEAINKMREALDKLENAIKKDDHITFDYRARQLDDSLSLPLGSIWRSRDLIDLFLTRSSNAASRAAALAVEDKRGVNFANLMNKKARELNMESYFINEN